MSEYLKANVIYAPYFVTLMVAGWSERRCDRYIHTRGF